MMQPKRITEGLPPDGREICIAGVQNPSASPRRDRPMGRARQTDYGLSGSRVIQYSVSAVGGVVNRAFTT